MARPRNPKRDEAKHIWLKSKGLKPLKDIAIELELSDTQIRKWKNQDKWDEHLNGNVTKLNGNVTKPKVTKKERKVTVEENNELTEKQQMFCLYYVKYFNATKAYQKAYECGYDSARANAPRLIANDSISTEIERLKAEQAKGMKLDAQSVLQKYIDIAFTDITDFVRFGKEEVDIQIGEKETIDEEGNPVTVPITVKKEYNYVDFIDYDKVDGTLITEVKQGKDGVSIKLADKMKALDMLSKYFDLFPDHFKRKIETERLDIEKKKFSGEIDKDDELIDEWVEAVTDDEK